MRPRGSVTRRWRSVLERCRAAGAPPAPRADGKNSPQLVAKLVMGASGVLNSPAIARSGQMKFRPCSSIDTWPWDLGDGDRSVSTTGGARCMTIAVARRFSSARFPTSTRGAPHRPRPALSCQAQVSSNGARRGGRRYALRIIAIAALALGAILTGCPPALAQPRPSAPAGAASPTQPFVSAQVQPAPAAPVVPAPSSDRPIGLPRVRDYAPILELRDIFFDTGKEAYPPRRREDSRRERSLVARPSRLPVAHRGALRQSGGHGWQERVEPGSGGTPGASCDESSRRAGC